MRTSPLHRSLLSSTHTSSWVESWVKDTGRIQRPSEHQQPLKIPLSSCHHTTPKYLQTQENLFLYMYCICSLPNLTSLCYFSESEFPKWMKSPSQISMAHILSWCFWIWFELFCCGSLFGPLRRFLSIEIKKYCPLVDTGYYLRV